MPPEAAHESIAFWIAGASLVVASALAPWPITSHTGVARFAAQVHQGSRNNIAWVRFTVVPCNYRSARRMAGNGHPCRDGQRGLPSKTPQIGRAGDLSPGTPTF